jgi:hypothetical protein
MAALGVDRRGDLRVEVPQGHIECAALPLDGRGHRFPHLSKGSIKGVTPTTGATTLLLYVHYRLIHCNTRQEISAFFTDRLLSVVGAPEVRTVGFRGGGGIDPAGRLLCFRQVAGVLKLPEVRN